jgi:hypothetical protein
MALTLKADVGPNDANLPILGDDDVMAGWIFSLAWELVLVTVVFPANPAFTVTPLTR